MMGVGMHMQMWGSRKARVPIPALSLSCCVTLSKPFNILGHTFPICKTRGLNYMIFEVPSSPDILYSAILFT